MRAVVTGGGGFIGSHLVEALVADGLEVVVVDDFRSGREENLAGVADRIRVVRVDIADGCEVVEPGDWVFHLAGMADIVPSIERPVDYFRANVVGTFNVLDDARKRGASRFVYVASSTCYGIPTVYPTPESAPIDCRYPYAETKYQGELLALHWAKVYGIPAISVRLFNVYGPRSRTSGAYGAVFGVFLAQKANGHPYTVVGDGTQTRDFTYVSDVVDALRAAAASDVSGVVMNVASGQPQSVNRLVELLGGADAVHVPKRPGEPDCTWADVSRAEELLDWRARVPFEEGVARMLGRMNDWRDAPVWTPESIEQATASWFAHLGS